MSTARALVPSAWRPLAKTWPLSPVAAAASARPAGIVCRRMKSAPARGSVADATSPSAQRKAQVDTIGLFMVPGTMVAPPFLRSIRERGSEGVKLQWARVKTKLRDAAAVMAFWFSSKPSILSPARVRINRRAILPTARALHRTMSEALAAGDKEALRRVCAPALYSELSSRIERRPKDRSYRWTLVGYSQPLRYPRIVDHKVIPVPAAGGRTKAVHQAVVAISSRQRLVQYTDKRDGSPPVPVPGSEKELDLVENLILNRPIDGTTFKAGDWTIFGHIEETTWKSWVQDARGLEILQRGHS